MLQPQELESEFRSLNIDLGVPGAVHAQTLIDDSLYIAVNSDGDYLCLVNDQREIANPPRRLRVISVDYGLKYKAVVNGSELSGNFTVLKLSSDNSHLLLTFCSLLTLLANTLGANPSPSELQHFVENFIELFAPKLGDPRERLKGLFGELSLIKIANQKSEFVKAWHENLNANKDFSFANAYLEVKTTEGSTRKHEFSATQLKSPFEGKPVLIASAVIEEDPQGLTVFQLLDLVQVGLAHSEQVKLIRVVFDTVGLDGEDAHEIRWVLKGDTSGVWVFKAEDLPLPIIDESDKKQSAISNLSFALNFEILKAAGVEYVQLPEIESELYKTLA